MTVERSQSRSQQSSVQPARERIQGYLDTLDTYGVDSGNCYWTPTPDAFKELCELALKGLASEKQESEWIAVKDQRPEGRDDVLVSTEGRYVTTRSAGWVRVLWDEAVREKVECAITHWKPMPKAAT